MTADAIERLWSPSDAFGSSATRISVGIVAAALILCPILTLVLSRAGRLGEKTRADIRLRYLTWLVLAPCMLGPVLLGAGPTIIMVLAASLLCYREFARATGLFRERLISFFVIVGIVMLAAAALDNYAKFFNAIPVTGVAIIAACAVLQDRPEGYIQRVAMGCVGLILFGASLAHLSALSVRPDYRPILCLLITALQLNDIFAYICGKSLGNRKAFPNTSPKKTIAGHVGAIVLTTIYVALLGRSTFAGTPMGDWPHLALLGVVISVTGQFGDLALSSIKRDLGVKDLAGTLPGHGGVSDRFNNCLVSAPVVFHLLNIVNGSPDHLPVRIFSAGWW